MTITVKQRDIALSNLQSTLRKIYGYVPIKEAWNANQIAHELKRNSQSIGNYHSLIGCLNSLKKLKLITEVKPGHFKQTECRKMKKVQKDENVNSFSDEPSKTEEIDPLQLLKNSVDKLYSIKTDIELAILEVEEHFSILDKKLEKLTQLQNLLKNINE